MPRIPTDEPALQSDRAREGAGSSWAPQLQTLRPAGLPQVVVRRSALHGRGLFAGERIERGRLIGVYEGPETRRNGAYVLWVERERGKVGIAGKNELRFVNHSKRPNAEFRAEECFALRAIRPGEEIVFDYGEDWD